MGDAEDREKLSKMTELEREEILADRRDVRSKTQDRKRIIQMAKDKKEREQGGRKKFKPSDAEKLTGRKSKRVAGEEEKRGTTNKSKALADIARKKADRVEASDYSGDDSEEYGSESDLEEELDGILPQIEKRKPARGWGRQTRGGSDDDSDDSDDDDAGGDNVPASEAQIRRIFLKRSTMEKWIAEPFLKNLVPGCMVRVGIGLDAKTGDNRYRVAEIVGIAEGKHGKYVLEPYEIVPNQGKNSAKTPFWLLLKFGDKTRAFRMSELSNGDASAKEFGEWQSAARETNQKPPRVRHVNVAVQNIQSANNYRYTSEDVQKILKQKNDKKGGLTHNLANQKEVLRRLIERARAGGDDDAVAQLTSQYDEVVKQLTSKLDKGGTQAIMANINKKNNAINDANLSRTAAEAVARAKSGKPDESMNDPFSRRPTRMASYYTINGGDKKDDGKGEAKGVAPVNATETSEQTETDPKTPKGTGSFAQTQKAKLEAATKAHLNVRLEKVDATLASQPDPSMHMGIHPGLVPVLRRGMLGLSKGLLEDLVAVRPKGKTLTLEEYKVRQGVE